MLRLLSAAVALFAAHSFAADAAVGYMQSNGYFKQDSRPTLYQPLNLLDGREGTAWCTPTADTLAVSLHVGFKGEARVDEVRVYTGNGFDPATFAEFSRAKKFSITGAHGGTNFQVSDRRGLQAVSFDPPLEGAYFKIDVLDIFPAEEPEASVCVTDLVFYSKGKALNGSWLTPKLKYDRSRALLLGTWFAGSPGAPDRYLSFFFDGTYRFVHDAFDPKVKDKVWTGDYEAFGGRLVLSVPGKGKVTAKYERKLEEDEFTGTKAHALQLAGELPADLKGPFRDQP